MLGGRTQGVTWWCEHEELVLGPFFVLSAYHVAQELTNQQHVALLFHCLGTVFSLFTVNLVFPQKPLARTWMWGIGHRG